MWGIVFVLITFVGTIGNIITILVLKNDPFISPLTILLIALAISDILAPQANAFISFSHYHLTKKYSDSVFYLKYSDFLRYVIQPLSTMFTMSSSWIVTTATLFRLIAIILPLRARSLITKKCVYISLVIIFGMGLISIIPIYSSLIMVTKCTKQTRIEYKGLTIQMNSDILQQAYIPFVFFF